MINFLDLPKEIQERMLDCQVEQGNERNPEVFINYAYAGFENGFVWDYTMEGHDFWNEIIEGENINHFYTRYPKGSNYPKVMMVSDSQCSDSMWLHRVVFMEKCGKYIAWLYADTIEEAEKETRTSAWKYAKDIYDKPKKVTISFAEIAKLINCDENDLIITK